MTPAPPPCSDVVQIDKTPVYGRNLYSYSTEQPPTVKLTVNCSRMLSVVTVVVNIQ